MDKSKNINDWFVQTIEELYEDNFWLAAEVTKLGYPKVVDKNDCPTASVGWNDHKKKLIFKFNKEVFEDMSREQFKFTICHEAIHVLNMHIFSFYDEITKTKKAKKTNIEIKTFFEKLNVAADCVVNDSLINLYNFNKIDSLIQSKKWRPVYGQEVVGMDCEDLAVMDVFYMLPKDLTEFGIYSHEFWKTFLNDDGTLKKSFIDCVKGLAQKNIKNSALSPKESEIIENIKKRLSESLDSNASKAGDSVVGTARSVSGPTGKALNWNRILFQLTETKKPRSIWNRTPRKLMSVYPDVVLPAMEDKEKEKIFVAIDTSGSIDREALSLFTDVIRNTPRQFIVESISFDTECYEWDVKGDQAPKGGGGTRFDIIEEYINTNFKKYPKAIFVLTDGEGNMVKPRYPKRWAWLLYGPKVKSCIGDMKNFDIKQMLK